HLAGIDLKDENVAFAGSHQAAIDKVLQGRADIGFVRDGVLEDLSQRGLLDMQQIKVINAQYRPGFPHLVSTRLYPEWPVFALPHVSDQAKRHVTAALLRFEKEDADKALTGVYGFSVAADYLQVEGLARALRLPPFDKREVITWQDLFAQYSTSIAWVLGLFLALVASLVFLIFWIKKALSAHLYSQELLASQDEIVLVNDGYELVDVSGGFFKFFDNYYDSLQAFKKDYQCICDLFVLREGYLFNHHGMDWIQTVVENPNQDHKAIVSYQGKQTVFKCNGVFAEKLGLYLITMVDITELEKINQQLVEQTRIADQANQTKTNFLANMSHEIRTPMNGIIGLSELALKEHNVEKLHQRLQKIHYSGSLLLGIINDILDISKIESGRLSLDPHPFHLRDFLNELVDMYRLSADKKGLKIKLIISDELAVGYFGDDLRLRQVLTNLLSNAIKFTDQGIVSIRASMDYEPSDTIGPDQAWLKVEVQDTGKGMTLEQQHRLFQPFSQADDSITRQYGGTGLGLVISDKLVQLMGGDHIQLQSELGQGSVFSFTVPLKHLSEKQLKKVKVRDELVGKPKQKPAPLIRSDVRLLLVEDNAINQEVAASMLEQLGLTLEVADNGEQAVQKTQENRFDLILMDIQMPVMDGYQATKRIRRFNMDVPIIALTAAAMIEDKEKALAAGMNDHLSKPISQEALQACMHQWLPHREQDAVVQTSDVVLIVHPDAKAIKAVAPVYRSLGQVRVANTIDKAFELLQAQPEISKVVLAQEWASHQSALAKVADIPFEQYA
ncbi:MAG: response regulator, partial [Hydrogenovibrio sp.]|uniref:response regulator n=1 Tax=Hydrogenovibrio sp. TaxID=2065821 RepID=UPI00287058E5